MFPLSQEVWTTGEKCFGQEEYRDDENDSIHDGWHVEVPVPAMLLSKKATSYRRLQYVSKQKFNLFDGISPMTAMWAPLVTKIV